MQTLCFQRRPIQCIQNSNCNTFVFDPVEPGPLQEEDFVPDIPSRAKGAKIFGGAGVGFCRLRGSANISGAAVDESLCNTPRVTTSSSPKVRMWVKNLDQGASSPETKCYKGSLLKDFGKTFSQQDIFLKKVCGEMAYAHSECYGRVDEEALVTTNALDMLLDDEDRYQEYEQHNLNVFNRQARYKLNCKLRNNQTVIRDELKVVDCYRRLRVNVGSYVNNLGVATALAAPIVMAFDHLDSLFGIGSMEPAQPKQCRRIAVALTITILACFLYGYLLASSQGIDLYEMATGSKPITKWPQRPKGEMGRFEEEGLDSSRLENAVQTRLDTLYTCYSIALLFTVSFYTSYLQAYRGKLASFCSTFLVELPWFCNKRPLYGTDRWGIVVRLFRRYASVHPEVTVKVRRNELDLTTTAPAPAARDIFVYVATNGSDSTGSGMTDSPLKTVDGVQEWIRANYPVVAERPRIIVLGLPGLVVLDPIPTEVFKRHAAASGYDESTFQSEMKQRDKVDDSYITISEECNFGKDADGDEARNETYCSACIRSPDIESEPAMQKLDTRKFSGIESRQITLASPGEPKVRISQDNRGSRHFLPGDVDVVTDTSCGCCCNSKSYDVQGYWTTESTMDMVQHVLDYPDDKYFTEERTLSITKLSGHELWKTFYDIYKDIERASRKEKGCCGGSPDFEGKLRAQKINELFEVSDIESRSYRVRSITTSSARSNRRRCLNFTTSMGPCARGDTSTGRSSRL